MVFALDFAAAFFRKEKHVLCFLLAPIHYVNSHCSKERNCCSLFRVIGPGKIRAGFKIQITDI